MAERVVLAYSGGLDTSVAVRWLIENEGVEVIAVAVIAFCQIISGCMKQRFK